ncbi:MAG TPA: O-antigen ligase family protein [candidate division Zixibacteria bacterium]|nr:O-antigen ligase family protein [candidate division Zixibacteria bacterium]
MAENIHPAKKIVSTGLALSALLFAAIAPWGHVGAYFAGFVGLLFLPFTSFSFNNSSCPQKLLMIFLGIFLICGLILSLFVAYNAKFALTTVFTYFAHWAIFFLIGLKAKPEHRKTILMIWLFSMLLVALMSLIALLGWIDVYRLSNEGLLKGFQSHIRFGTLLLIAFHFVFALFLNPKNILKQTIGLGLFATILLVMIVLTGSRGVWFAAAISIFGATLHAIFTNRKRKLAIALVVIAVALGVIVSLSANIIHERIRRTGTDDPSYVFRKNNATMALWIIEDRPLTGIGPGQVPYAKSYFDRMADENLELESGYLKKRHLHSMYLHVGAELGLPGLMLLIGVLICFIWMAIIGAKSQEAFPKTMSYGFLWATVAVAIGEMLDCLLRGPSVAMELFFFAGIIAGIAAENSDSHIGERNQSN